MNNLDIQTLLRYHYHLMNILTVEKYYKVLFYLSILIAIATASSYLLMNINVLDEGVMAMQAYRISENEVIYKDFFAFVTPLSYMILGFLYKIFGATILTGRIFGLMVSLLCVVIYVLILEKNIKNRLYSSLAVALLCQAGFSAWPYPSHHTLANLFAITALFFFLNKENKINYFLFGGFSALTFWTLQDEGLYLIVATIILLGIIREGRKQLFSYAFGGLVFSLPLVLYLLIFVPFGKLNEYLIKYPFTVYNSNPKNSSGVISYLMGIIKIWETGQFIKNPIYSFIATTTSCFIIFIPLIALLILIFMLKNKIRERKLLYGSTILYISFMGTALHHLTFINLIFAAFAPTLVLVCFLDCEWQNSPQRRFKTINILVLILTIFFLIVGLRSIHSVSKPKSLTALKTKAGTLYVFRPAQAKLMQELVDKIEQNVPREGHLLTREMPLVNFLTKRPNPIGIDYFQPPDDPPEEWTREKIKEIDSMEGLWIATLKTSSGKSVFDSYMDKNYEQFFTNRALILWRKKTK